MYVTVNQKGSVTTSISSQLSKSHQNITIHTKDGKYNDKDVFLQIIFNIK